MSATSGRLAWTDGNAIELLHNGAEFFPALCAAIEGAQHSIHLETYIFRLDRSGRVVLQALERAARRGVRLRLVLDGFGSAASAEMLVQRLRAAGGQCRIYRPEPSRLGWLKFSRRRLRRLHRKMAVVDGRIAFVGGINIVDDHDDADPARVAPRLDYAVRVEGPLVAQARQAQASLWLRLNWARHPGLWRHGLGRRHAASGQGPLRAALVLRDNLRYRRTFERIYLAGIDNAQREILIANAYFFPGRRFREALLRAAARGLRVRLLLQGKPDYYLQYFATRALYEPLLQAGIEIYEYMPSGLHAKVAVIDGIATVGSSNLDPFSLLLAREANVLVDDAAFAQRLQTSLEQVIAEGGQRVRASAYRERGWWRRAGDALAYRALRLAAALTGRRDDY